MKRLFLISILSLVFNRLSAQYFGQWYEPNINAYLELLENGNYNYKGPDGNAYGQYMIQQNILSLQAQNGQFFQFLIQGISDNQMTITSNNVILYFQKVGKEPKIDYPWNKDEYQKVLAQADNVEWLEKHTQLYVALMELLISQKLNETEISRVRTANVKDFKENPQMMLNDVAQVEQSMQLIYQQKSAEAIAQIQEQLWAALYQQGMQSEEFMQTEIMQILMQYVQIYSFDAQTSLSLSNQDIEGYINYLQFQNMLIGQNYQLSEEEYAALQMQLINQFPNYPTEQKQVLAYAGFLWRVVANEWNALSQTEQQQIIQNTQQQLAIQGNNNQNVEWNQPQNNYEVDIEALEARYRQEAAKKGMTLEQYIDYKKRDMQVNNEIFNTMQNMMTEDHATMLNIINNLGSNNDYYYVDYNNY